MKNYKIGIIGAGQIGSRHLQALASIDRTASIQIVDPSEDSLNVAKQRFDEVSESSKVKKIEYFSNISDFDAELDCVIIATTASVRRKVIEKLLAEQKVKSLILEKVLFQSLDDYSIVSKLLKKLKIKAWVNFPRRIWPIYQEIKEKIGKENLVSIQVTGSHWDLACNGLHFIDLFSYLSECTQFNVSPKLLNDEVIPSKRDNVIEITGTLQGNSEQGEFFSITSYPTGKTPIVTHINSPSKRFIVSEGKGIALFADESTEWKWQENSFTIPYQSQLTHIMVQQIFDTGTCELTNYDDAWKIHKPFIEALLIHFEKIKVLKEDKICPIT